MSDNDTCHDDAPSRRDLNPSESIDLLAAIIDALPAVISAKDRNSRYLVMNRYQAELYGTTPEDAVGRTAGELLGEGYGAYTAARDRIVMETGRPLLPYEETYPDTHGIEHDWLTTKVPLKDADGTVRGIASVSLDISDRKRAEQDLIGKSVALERVNAELVRLTRAATHDLREPVRQIMSHVQLMARQLGDGLPDSAREHLAFALEGAARLDKLFEGFIAYAHLDSQHTVRAAVDLDAVLDDTLARMEAHIRATDARITREPLPRVTASREHMSLLFEQLLSNALKFRHPERAPEIHLIARPRKADHAICVADNGMGIEPRYQKRVFEIFERLNPREMFPGEGIGLAICQKIVEMHGGRIQCQSNPGEGSCFTFTIRAP